jgi:multidrug efflux pump
VFLCLAALYESWSIPLAVILVVPLGVLGVVLAVLGHRLPNDVYFQIGLVTIIGLSAKNAILIIEFAKDLQAQGRDVADAALEAARMRFRPILMTSLAFSFGVLPLYLASGASSASQRAIGTGVLGGMISGTLLAIFFVPTFFAIVRRYFKGSRRQQAFAASHAAALHARDSAEARAARPAGSD